MQKAVYVLLPSCSTGVTSEIQKTSRICMATATLIKKNPLTPRSHILACTLAFHTRPKSRRMHDIVWPLNMVTGRDTRYSGEVDWFWNKNEEMESIKWDGVVEDYFTGPPLKPNKIMVSNSEIWGRVKVTLGLENAYEYLRSQMGSARTTPRLMSMYLPVTVPGRGGLPVLAHSGWVPVGTMWKVEGLSRYSSSGVGCRQGKKKKTATVIQSGIYTEGEPWRSGSRM